MNESELKVEIEMKGLKMFVRVTCPQCQTVIEKASEELPPGSSIPCSCGLTINITGDGFAGSQKALDRLKKTIDRFGK